MANPEIDNYVHSVEDKLREANRRLQDSYDGKIDALEDKIKSLESELDSAYETISELES